MCILLDTSASCLLLCVFFGWQLNSCSSRLKQSPQGISQCSSFTVSIFHDQSYSLVRTTLPFPTPSTPFMALSLDTPVVTRTPVAVARSPPPPPAWCPGWCFPAGALRPPSRPPEPQHQHGTLPSPSPETESGTQFGAVRCGDTARTEAAGFRGGAKGFFMGHRARSWAMRKVTSE